MSVHVEASFELEADADAIVRTMTDPTFIDGSERSRGALSVEVVEKSRTEDALDYEVHVTKHAHSVTGVDPSRTERHETEFHWDLRRREVRWTWHGPHGPKVEIHGQNRVSPEGRRAKLHMSADISIGIPLVGRVVEKKIKAGFEEQWPAYARRLRDALGQV